MIRVIGIFEESPRCSTIGYATRNAIIAKKRLTLARKDKRLESVSVGYDPGYMHGCVQLHSTN